MNNLNLWKHIFTDFVTVVSEITLSIAIIGSIFAGNTKINYQFFFMPFILGIICMLPCLITYFKEDLSVKLVIAQKIFELIVLEICIIAILHYLLDDVLGLAGYIAIAFSILLLDIISYLTKWFLEKEESDKINEKLREFQMHKRN